MNSEDSSEELEFDVLRSNSTQCCDLEEECRNLDEPCLIDGILTSKWSEVIVKYIGD